MKLKMLDLKLFWKCLFSPALYTVHKGGQHWGRYDPNDWEKWGDKMVTSIFLLWNIGVYSSPVLLCMLFKKGYFTVGGAVSLVKLSIGLGVFVTASYCIRSYGRTHNMKYRTFLTSLEKVHQRYSDETKKEIKNYDFDFDAWPIEFTYDEATGKKKKDSTVKRSWSKLVQSPCSIVSYIVLHSFGIRLIYPGSIRALSYMMGSALVQGRSKLIDTDEGERFKLKTSDGNVIDTMFIDKRKFRPNGKTLVICSEGNAGFYEYGIMVTPIKAGYSVLGWNHPGFAGSSGMPYPEEEQTAMDTVMQFAIVHLGFLPEDIVLFGWSIGGYTTTWAAMNYPDVKAVVLDATFDDLLPLAIPRMPASLESIVRLTIKQYANLDIARQLVHYPGPVLMFRRAEDEVICIEPNELSSNRGNHLLVKLLRHRYPFLVDQRGESVLQDWMSVTGTNQNGVYTKHSVLSDERCRNLLSGSTFPSSVGEDMDTSIRINLLLYLAKRYMVDFASTHCTPLPSSLFQVPQPL